MSYEVRCDGVTEKFEAEDRDAARAWVRQWLKRGDWHVTPEGGTIWVHAYLIDADADDRERVTVRIDPREPKCTHAIDGHDWRSPHAIVGGLRENPGVFGHGGGVVIREVCMRCGCSRETDSWATDSATGEQGLESVRYEPGKYADEIDADDGTV